MTKKYTTLVILILTLMLSRQFSIIGATPRIRAAQDPPAQETQGLVLDVKPTKLVYAKNEPVELDITLRNAGKHRQIVARRLSLGMRITLVILDPQGKSAKWCGRISDEIVVLKGNYKTLSPGESVHAKLTITCGSAKDPGHGGYVLDAPGKYVIKAAYRLPIPKEDYERAFPNADVIRGPVWAEPITIELQ